MSAKKLNYFFLTSFVVLGILYFKATTHFMASVHPGDIDARYFPRILAVLLILLCIISFVQSLKNRDEKLNFENMHLILATIGITIAYFFTWSLIGFFYPLTFLFLMGLFILYKEKPRFDKGLITAAILSFSITAFIYVVFDWVMSVQF